MIACILYYIPFLLVCSYLLFASLCTRVSLSSSSFSLICSLVFVISRSSLVTSIFNDQTAGTDSPVCSLGITTISPGVNALRLHGWRHPLLSYLPLVLFFHSASQPFSWCWCGSDIHALPQRSTEHLERPRGVAHGPPQMSSKHLEVSRGVTRHPHQRST